MNNKGVIELGEHQTQLKIESIKKVGWFVMALVGLLWALTLPAQASPRSGRVAVDDLLSGEQLYPHAAISTSTPTATATATATATITATSMPTATPIPTRYNYIPLINPGVKAWAREERDETVRQDAFSLGICPSDPKIRYLGALDGLYKWDETNKAWKQINPEAGEQATLGTVRDVLVSGNNCEDVFAAALANGLWEIKGSTATPISKGQPPVRSVSRRDNLLFVGTDEGILIYDVDAREWPDIDTGVTNLIPRQSRAGNRIYASVWGVGVVYNDECAADTCVWKLIDDTPPNHVYVRDVLGSPANAGNWILIATSTGIAYWDGSWHEPAKPPEPAGDVFALAQWTGSMITYAAVEWGGIWATSGNGNEWGGLGDLPYPIIDLTLGSDGLYATTTNNGVWLWPLP